MSAHNGTGANGSETPAPATIVVPPPTSTTLSYGAIVTPKGKGAILSADAPVDYSAKYAADRQALAECEQIDECQKIADKVTALAIYAKQAHDRALLNYTLRVKARAVRRCGELLQKIDPAKGGDRKSKGGRPPVDSRKAAAKAAGLSAHQTKQSIRVAMIPKADFERLVESDTPPTVTELAGQGKPRVRRRTMTSCSGSMAVTTTRHADGTTTRTATKPDPVEEVNRLASAMRGSIEESWAGGIGHDMKTLIEHREQIRPQLMGKLVRALLKMASDATGWANTLHPTCEPIDAEQAAKPDATADDAIAAVHRTTLTLTENVERYRYKRGLAYKEAINALERRGLGKIASAINGYIKDEWEWAVGAHSEAMYRASMGKRLEDLERREAEVKEDRRLLDVRIDDWTRIEEERFPPADLLRVRGCLHPDHQERSKEQLEAAFHIIDALFEIGALRGKKYVRIRPRQRAR
jgi:hypothetical protein